MFPALGAGHAGHCNILDHFNFEMLRWLREQTPAVEAQALFICAIKRRNERVLNFKNTHFKS